MSVRDYRGQLAQVLSPDGACTRAVAVAVAGVAGYGSWVPWADGDPRPPEPVRCQPSELVCGRCGKVRGAGAGHVHLRHRTL